jgi:hypothetical protein
MTKLKAGDWVEVLSKEEILSTLDATGKLDGMPFMPQMFQYCGKRFRVYQRAHKTCDTVESQRARRLPGGIHLNLRCDGKAHGGCQAACLIFWKEDWLRPVDDNGWAKAQRASGLGCSEEDVVTATRLDDRKLGTEPRYSCQATELRNYTTPLPWWDARQYVEDYTSGNASLAKLARGFIYLGYFYGTLAKSVKFGGPARWIYDRFQTLWGGLPWPRHRGTLPAGEQAPRADLNLQPGDFVRIKSYEEILNTLDAGNKNRGLHFDGEMMPFCGGTYRVRSRVERFINEQTGYMTRLKTPAVMLDGVICQARYSCHRMFCPRSIFSWWREVWLEPVSVGEQPLTVEEVSDHPRRHAA